MSILYVTGAGTEIGKTHVACAVLAAMRAQGRACAAFKPVLSGYDPEHPEHSDAGRLLAALGQPITQATLDHMSPWRYRAPLAPPLAARAEGATLRFDDILSACRARARDAGEAPLLIEGAGGVMAPVTDGRTWLDLMTALPAPVLFVGGTYLGAVSHALTGLAALAARGLSVAAIVLSESEQSTGLAPTRALLAPHTGAVPILEAPRTVETPWAAQLAQIV